MESKTSSVVRAVKVLKDNKERSCEYFTQKKWTCPFCWDDGAYEQGGKVKLGEKCNKTFSHDKPYQGKNSFGEQETKYRTVAPCTAVVSSVDVDKVEKPKVRRLLKMTDNRGNELLVSTCGDNKDAYRKGKHCKQPCLAISGTNVQTSSARSHTIHLAVEHVEAVIKALREGIDDGTKTFQ